MPIQQRSPIGNGTAQGDEWIPHGAAEPWQCVADPIGQPDDDVTYISVGDGGGGPLQSVAFDVFTVPDGADVLAVRVFSRHRVTADSYNPIIEIFVGGSWSGFTGAEVAAVDGYVDWLAALTENPETDLPWTVADVNGLTEVGVAAASVQPGAQARCTQIYIEVEFQEAEVLMPWTATRTTVVVGQPVEIYQATTDGVSVQIRSSALIFVGPAESPPDNTHPVQPGTQGLTLVLNTGDEVYARLVPQAGGATSAIVYVVACDPPAVAP